MQAVARREIDMIAAWSVDRLGRSLTDLLGVLQELHAKGVDLYLHQQGLDTSTPSGRAMFKMLGVFPSLTRHDPGARHGRAGASKGRRHSINGPRPSRMTQPRSERSEPPAPQARASAPSRVSTASASERFRASPHRSLSVGASTMRPVPIAPPECVRTRPLAPPESESRNGRNATRQNF